MEKAPLKVKCECGKKAHRNWNAYGNVVGNANGYPHESASLGINVSQIEEAKKIWPDAVFNPKNGNFVVTSRNCKLQMANRRNMVELE